MKGTAITTIDVKNSCHGIQVSDGKKGVAPTKSELTKAFTASISIKHPPVTSCIEWSGPKYCFRGGFLCHHDSPHVYDDGGKKRRLLGSCGEKTHMWPRNVTE